MTGGRCESGEGAARAAGAVDGFAECGAGDGAGFRADGVFASGGADGFRSVAAVPAVVRVDGAAAGSVRAGYVHVGVPVSGGRGGAALVGVYGGEEAAVSGFVARLATREAGDVTRWCRTKNSHRRVSYSRMGVRATISRGHP